MPTARRRRPEQSCVAARRPEGPSHRAAYNDAGTLFSSVAAGLGQAVLRLLEQYYTAARGPEGPGRRAAQTDTVTPFNGVAAGPGHR